MLPYKTTHQFQIQLLNYDKNADDNDASRQNVKYFPGPVLHALPLIAVPTELLIFSRKCRKVLFTKHDEDFRAFFCSHVNPEDIYICVDGDVERNLI